MGSKKYRPLKPREIIRVLGKFGFVYKGSTGDHDYYEGIVKGRRYVTTVPHYSEIHDPDLMKSIIQNSGLSREVFYGETSAQEITTNEYKECERCKGKGDFKPLGRNLPPEIIWPKCPICNGSGDANNPTPPGT